MNRELTVPHTVVLPIELYPPLKDYYVITYVEVIRTPINKYQKFMTYRLVYNIFMINLYYIKVWVVRLEPTWELTHLVLSETCLPIPAYP